MIFISYLISIGHFLSPFNLSFGAVVSWGMISGCLLELAIFALMGAMGAAHGASTRLTDGFKFILRRSLGFFLVNLGCALGFWLHPSSMFFEVTSDLLTWVSSFLVFICLAFLALDGWGRAVNIIQNVGIRWADFRLPLSR